MITATSTIKSVIQGTTIARPNWVWYPRAQPKWVWHPSARLKLV